MAAFKWTEKTTSAALALAQGHSCKAVARKLGIGLRTIYRWNSDTEFAAEVDRLSCMVNIAGRAERTRLAMRAVRQNTEGTIDTKKDVLDWLKFAQRETQGIRLDLTALAEAGGEARQSDS